MAICQYNCYDCHAIFYKMGCRKYIFFYIFNTIKDQYDLDIILYSNEHPKNSHVILEQFVYSGYANM